MARTSKECEAIHPQYKFCIPPENNVKQIVKATSPRYKRFVDNIVSRCKPYDGPRVFVIFSNGGYKLVCPTYKICLARRWYSLSIASNGFMYIHLLRNFVPTTHDCVYSGAHITVGPHFKSNTHVHFHITNIEVTVKDGSIHNAKKENHAICSIPYDDIERTVDDKSLFEALRCLQDNMNIRDVVWDSVRFDQLDETVELLLALMKKGSSPHKSS